MPSEWWEAYSDAVKGDKASKEFARAWVVSRGNWARVLPNTYAKDPSEKLKHVDKGDLEVIWREFGAIIKRIMGVKHRSLRFTNREDFPWPTLNVCNLPSWEHADPKPYGFINLNRDWTHAAIIWSSTFDAWTKRLSKDHRRDRGEEEWIYECPIGCVQFFNIREKRNEQ